MGIFSTLDSLFPLDENSSPMLSLDPVRMHCGYLNIQMLDPSISIMKHNVWSQQMLWSGWCILFDKHCAYIRGLQHCSQTITYRIMPPDYVTSPLTTESMSTTQVDSHSTRGLSISMAACEVAIGG